jgi:hypothetical protein
MSTDSSITPSDDGWRRGGGGRGRLQHRSQRARPTIDIAASHTRTFRLLSLPVDRG